MSTSPTFTAAQRLMSTTVQSVETILDALAGTGKSVLQNTTDSAVDIIQHQLGQDFANGDSCSRFSVTHPVITVAKHGTSLGMDVYETAEKLHHASGRKFLTDFAKAARQSACKLFILLTKLTVPK